MKLFFNLCRVEYKRLSIIFPKVLGKTFILLVLVGMAAWLGQKWMEGDSTDRKLTVAICQEEESKTGNLAIFYLKNSESLSDLYRYVFVSREEGLGMLDEGTAAVLIDCPPEVIEGIINGTNEPVSLYFKKETPMVTLLCREMAIAGETVLSTAQAEIYGAYDLTQECGLASRWDQICGDLNHFHINMILNREDFFKNQLVRATGEASYGEHYLASGLVFFLLLWGMNLQGFLQESAGAVRRQLEQAGIGIWKQTGISLAVISLAGGMVLFFLLIGIQIIDSLGIFSVNGIILYWGWETFVYISSMSVCISSILVLCCQFAPKGSALGMLIFAESVILIFISGGILPSIFLPVPIRRVADFLPGVWMIRETTQFLKWDFDHWRPGYLWLFAGVGYMFSCIYGSMVAKRGGRI